jgi:hypothetical protein
VSPFTGSARRQGVSARAVDARPSNIESMDVISVVLAIVMFAILLGLIYGIEQI